MMIYLVLLPFILLSAIDSYSAFQPKYFRVAINDHVAHNLVQALNINMSPQIISSNNKVNDGFSDKDNKNKISITTSKEENNLISPTFDDMKQLALILANITEHIDSSPEVALSIASKEMGWLYARNIPK